MWSNTWFMFGKAWKYEKSVLAVMVLTIVLEVGMNLMNLYIGPAVLRGLEEGWTLARISQTILIFAGGMMLVGAVQGYVELNYPYAQIFVRIKLFLDYFKKCATVSYSKLDDQKFTKMQQKGMEALNQNSAAGEHIWQTLTSLGQSICGIVLYLMILSVMNPFLMLLVAATTAVSFFFSRRIYDWGYRNREEEAEYTKKWDYLTERYKDRKCAKDIRMFGMGAWLRSLHAGARKSYEAFQARKSRKYFLANVIDTALVFLRNSVVYVYLLQMVLDNHMGASEFLLYFSAVNGFSSWMEQLLTQVSQLYQESTVLSTYREYLDTEDDYQVEEGMEIPLADAYEIMLKHVSFRYPQAEKNTLTDINLTLHPGEKLAVVGLNGAGKTTLVKLICGFYDPTEGEVLLNGVNIRNYRRKSYYEMFTAVFQQFAILPVTIAENVSQTGGNYDEARVMKCLAQADLMERVNELEQGCRTLMERSVYTDGAELSGGETQRLMLARALYKDGIFMILDEPTAALDPIAESAIYEKYSKMADCKTSVFISHRLASTRFCDRILFMEQGEIAEEGTHEALLAKRGKYAELFEVQSRYYREGGDHHEEGCE